jgi:hypothetical protein
MPGCGILTTAAIMVDLSDNVLTSSKTRERKFARK